MDTWSSGKNKPNSNPIQSQSNPIKANKTTKQTQYKPKQTQFKSNIPDFSLQNCKVNFHAQKIDGSVQISKISENVCFAHKGLCFIGRYRP
jgi:hypothetical protein